MKIYADKIDREPPHGIRISEVRRILAAAPTGWLADVAEVHISNALGHHSCAYFNRYNRTLTIYSRGVAPRQLVAPILSELAAHALGVKHRRWHRLCDADAHRIQHVIEPIVEQITPTLPPSPPRPVYHPSYVIRPIRLANESDRS